MVSASFSCIITGGKELINNDVVYSVTNKKIDILGPFLKSYHIYMDVLVLRRYTSVHGFCFVGKELKRPCRY